MHSLIDWVSAHQVMSTVGAFWILSAAIGALPAPTSQSGSFYQWFFKFANTLGGNVLRALSTKIEGSPNWTDAVQKHIDVQGLQAPTSRP